MSRIVWVLKIPSVRNGRLMTGFDFMILMDEVQQIQLLTFVFMQTFGLNIKYSIGI